MGKLIQSVLIWLGAVGTLYTVWTIADFKNDPFIWAVTVTTILVSIQLILTVCAYQHGVINDRLQKCAIAKKRLEEQVLKNRRSSRK